MTSIARQFFELTAHQRPSVGDMKTSAIGIDHMGWLVCDGRALNIVDFPQLFNVIGQSFGSNTSNDFKLPAPAGRVPGFVGSGAGLTTRALGASVGTETHTLTIAEMPTHNHTINDPGHDHSYFNQPNNHQVFGTGNNSADDVNVNQTTGSNTTGITINNEGSNAPHNNMQPTLFVGNMFIYSGRPFYGSNAITPTFPYTSGIYVQSTASPGSNLA